MVTKNVLAKILDTWGSRPILFGSLSVSPNGNDHPGILLASKKPAHGARAHEGSVAFGARTLAGEN